eukprot:scaffold109176_cov62-Phaeocystis_antarctica.AAC.5
MEPSSLGEGSASAFIKCWSRRHFSWAIACALPRPSDQPDALPDAPPSISPPFGGPCTPPVTPVTPVAPVRSGSDARASRRSCAAAAPPLRALSLRPLPRALRGAAPDAGAAGRAVPLSDRLPPLLSPLAPRCPQVAAPLDDCGLLPPRSMPRSRRVTRPCRLGASRCTHAASACSSAGCCRSACNGKAKAWVEGAEVIAVACAVSPARPSAPGQGWGWGWGPPHRAASRSHRCRPPHAQAPTQAARQHLVRVRLRVRLRVGLRRRLKVRAAPRHRASAIPCRLVIASRRRYLGARAGASTARRPRGQWPWGDKAPPRLAATGAARRCGRHARVVMCHAVAHGTWLGVGLGLDARGCSLDAHRQRHRQRHTRSVPRADRSGAAVGAAPRKVPAAPATPSAATGVRHVCAGTCPALPPLPRLASPAWAGCAPPASACGSRVSRVSRRAARAIRIARYTIPQ